jgi:hypothetical protein
MSYRGALEIDLHVRKLERSRPLAPVHESPRAVRPASSSSLAARSWLASALRGLAVRLTPGASREPANVL